MGLASLYIKAVMLNSVFVTGGGSCVMKVYEVVFQKFSSADPVCICGSKRKTHKNPTALPKFDYKAGRDLEM